MLDAAGCWLLSANQSVESANKGGSRWGLKGADLLYVLTIMMMIMFMGLVLHFQSIARAVVFVALELSARRARC